jgi:tetraacyldisaccharide 4'-kinase
LSENFSVATLSRGIRESLKVLLADASSNAEILGDEPFQFLRSSKNIKWPCRSEEWDSAIAFKNAKPE